MILNFLITYQTPLSWALGFIMGFLIGLPIGAAFEKKKNGLGKTELQTTIILTFIFIIWMASHLNQQFLHGASVGWIFDIIGGLSTASLIQEKEVFVNLVKAIRGIK